MKLNLYLFLVYFQFQLNRFASGILQTNSNSSFVKKRSVLDHDSINNNKIVCYYTSWSRNRNGANLEPENIDPNLCTHINYAFAKIRFEQLVPSESYLEETFERSVGLYSRINSLKHTNPRLNVLLSIGSFDLNGELKRFIYDRSKRLSFINSALKLVKKYGFDGIDLNFDEKKHY